MIKIGSIIEAVLSIIVVTIIVAIAADYIATHRRAAGLETRLAQASAAADEWASAVKTLQGRLTDCTEQWADAQGRAEAAQAQADAAREAARQQHRDFQARWDARSSDCTAALEDMGAACAAEIGDY